MRQGNEPPDGEAVAGCASEDAQPADLGLLLSQILTAPAFPRAASEHAVRSAAADIGITDVGDEPDLELRELRVAPGMVRAIGHRHFGRKGGGRRRAISGFSDASRRNLLRRLGTLDFSVVRGIPVVITLTYPADWRPWCATGADAKQQLVSFRREWAKRWGEFQGIVLAAAGLKRLELGHRIAQYCDPAFMLPAVGQAALGLECLADRHDVIDALEVLNHRPTHLAVSAERELALRLGGSCRVPLAAHASLDQDQMHLRACIQLSDGRMLHAEDQAKVTSLEGAIRLGGQVAGFLMAQGARPWSSQDAASPWVNAPSS
ncbi:MAG: hypothetical protein EBV68_05920 [Betaproteobacteria bacterium]|nr:hypothetical protein [Betaproteobacteria bacterium]